MYVESTLLNAKNSARLFENEKFSPCGPFVGLAYQGKDIVFRFIIEY
jgi:hypothetical protein